MILQSRQGCMDHRPNSISPGPFAYGGDESEGEPESEEESESVSEKVEAKKVMAEKPKEKPKTAEKSQEKPRTDEKAEKPLIDKSKYVKPYFDEQDEDVYAIGNKPFTITCKFNGVPTPKITWMFEDEIIHSDDHFGVIVDEKKMVTILEIDNVTYDDIGEYECIAVNAKGYGSAKLYLDVAEPPAFVEKFEDTTIPFGWSLRLDCRLDGIPEPEVVWCKDDMPLKQSGRVKYLFEGEDGASLLLENFSRSDCGEYSIVAANVAGEVSHSVLVTAPGVTIEPVKKFLIKKDIKIEEEYDILDELGRGAYGIVKKAIDKRSQEERAAKFITIKAGMWEEVRNEIRVMGMLNHKRLIGLYDAYETNENNKKEINMVMELVTGGELFERIVAQDTITESEAVYFLKQVIEGVHHMHEKNIVHLDLKPENILLESAESDLIKVIDFGLAQVLKPDEELKCSCGTAEFVAPEIVNKKPVTTASDVWSIGVIAYILLSGCSPFMGEDDRQTLMNVREGHWDFEEDIWDEISEEAKDFISKLLEVDVSKRYTLKQCLDHPWLKFDERRDRGLAKLSTDRLKNFNLRRKWRKALNAVRSIMRLQRLASLIKEEEEEEEGEESNQNPDGEMAQTLDTVPEEPVIEGTEEMVEETPPMNHIGEERDVHIEPQENHVDYEENQRFERKEREVDSAQSKHHKEDGRGAEETEGAVEDKPFFTQQLEDVYLFEEGTLFLSCLFCGNPEPKITWYRGDQVISRRANHIQCWREDCKRACLRIVHISLEEGGEIRCVAENNSGSAETRCKVHVSEEPDLPSRPKVPLISSDEVLLTWKVDVHPGKPEVTGYTVMIKQFGDEGWSLLEDDVLEPSLHVTGLKPNTEYRFRVSCITKYGKGQLGKPSVLVKTSPPGAQPLTEEVVRAQKLTHSRCISYDRRLSTDSLCSDGDESEEEDMLIQDLGLNKHDNPKQIYDFLMEIDRGRYAVVRKCRRKENSKEYAAKLMKLSQKSKNRCLEEHKILQELKHPNIVQLREAFQTEDLVVLIMGRYFAGDVLKHITRTDIFTEDLIANISLQILDALNYLRMNKIVFLDLRHDNLLIESRRRERIRLVDFGSARKISWADSVRVPRMELLTEFIAPEIAEGNEIAHETDIWSLGVLVFTWLSGVSPFMARTEEKTLYNITRIKYNIESLQDNVSEEAREFLKKIFVQDPSERLSVSECFDDPWLHCNVDMVNKRSSIQLITRRLRKYRSDYRARAQVYHIKQPMFI